jgi:hypothetical protein
MDETFNEKFPAGWKDPLELCGSFVRYLLEDLRDLNEHRELLRDLIKMYGSDWVWQNRNRLVALMAFLFTPSMN